MIDRVVDDVLEMIARAAVRRCAEIDDAARIAASLALTSRRVSAVMSGVAWKEVSALAQMMDPCVASQAIASSCEARTARKKDLATVAVSAKLPRAKTMSLADLEEVLDKGDALVGSACPIPLAAAAYVVRMSFRWMPAVAARAKFSGRDFGACEYRAGGYRFSDLRRAPVLPPPVLEDRTKAIAFLDALFSAEKPRPWWVRTMADADFYFRREKLVEDGYPLVAAKWSVSGAELRNFKEVCEHLRVKMSAFSASWGPGWAALRFQVLMGTHKAFMLCGDALPQNGEFSLADLKRVRARLADATHTIRDVPESTLEASHRVMQRWLPVRATISTATAAILLKHAGLPMEVAWWRIDDEREVLHDLAKDALEVSRLLSVPLHYTIEGFATAVTEVARTNLGDADPPEPDNGRFITAKQYLKLDSSWPPKR